MAQRKPSPQKETQYMTDDDTSDEEVDPHLQTPKERQYGTVPASAQATQAALAHTRAQTNPTIERGPPRQDRRRKPQHNSTSTQQHKDKIDKRPK